MTDAPPLELHDTRERFLAMVEDIRPQLHRYCARMTGSLADGEDVVQDTLAKAYYTLSMRQSVPNLRPWLFRIAHNRALDWLRRYEHKNVVSMDEIEVEPVAEAEQDPVERIQATALALSCFFHLPVRPRAAVILKDVLGHSIAEVTEILQMTTPAVKAALNRDEIGFSLRRVPSQGDNVLDPYLVQPLQDGVNLLFGLANAGQVGHYLQFRLLLYL